jgi:hypothetical protein
MKNKTAGRRSRGNLAELAEELFSAAFAELLRLLRPAVQEVET